MHSLSPASPWQGLQGASLRGSRHTVLEGWESLHSHLLPAADSQLTSTCFR